MAPGVYEATQVAQPKCGMLLALLEAAQEGWGLRRECLKSSCLDLESEIRKTRTWKMHQNASQELAWPLQWTLGFSSTSSLFGYAGQAQTLNDVKWWLDMPAVVLWSC